MSSNSPPSGNNATNNYRKLTLYLNSQMKGKSSRHLNSQMNTKIFRCNGPEQCTSKLCSLKLATNMCGSVGARGDHQVTDLAGVNQEGSLTVDFTCFLCKWRHRLGLQRETNSRCWDLFPLSVASGLPFAISIHLKSWVPPTQRLLEGDYTLSFLCSSVSWQTAPLGAFMFKEVFIIVY